jgi:glycine/D-amino acid oxidase-like deaminating enzyme
MNDWDVIIVGQGLAGTTLAWHLNWRGARVLLIDRDEDFTSSKIAAGLITPITGQRLVKTWRFDELWNSAKSFYEKVEQLTATPFFRLTSQVRLFANEKEPSRFAERKFDGDEIEQPVPLIDSHSFHNLLGGFQMNQSAQLNVSDFLTASRTYFEKNNAWLKADVQASDIAIQSDGIVLAKHGLTAKRLIFWFIAEVGAVGLWKGTCCG